MRTDCFRISFVVGIFRSDEGYIILSFHLESKHEIDRLITGRLRQSNGKALVHFFF